LGLEKVKRTKERRETPLPVLSVQIRPNQVSAADFKTLRTKMIELHKGYSDCIVNMRFKLLAITPELNWEGLAKELNGIFPDVAVGLL
jgi:hypothetical protein